LLALLPVAVEMGGCGRSRRPAPEGGGEASAPRSGAPRADLPLPDVIEGFAAGPTTPGAGFLRRTYARGATLISVTLARVPMDADGYASWTRTSVASFPQARLDAPAADANGFYQCSSETPPHCDLLIQLRSGVHVEVRGGGTSTRDDVDAVARGLPLRALAAPPAGP
jgi:hypothetical protein